MRAAPGFVIALSLVVCATGCLSFNQQTLGDFGTPPRRFAGSRTLAIAEVTSSSRAGRREIQLTGGAARFWVDNMPYAFRRSKSFFRVMTRSQDADLRVRVHVKRIRRPQDSRLELLSTLTIFLIPVRVREWLELTTVFESPSGEELGRFVKTEEMVTWRQTLLFFFAPIGWPDPVRIDILRDLVDATLVEADAAGALTPPAKPAT